MDLIPSLPRERTRGIEVLLLPIQPVGEGGRGWTFNLIRGLIEILVPCSGNERGFGEHRGRRAS